MTWSRPRPDLGQASALKNVTKDAVLQTKEALAAEAKMVAKDMADLKAPGASGSLWEPGRSTFH